MRLCWEKSANCLTRKVQLFFFRLVDSVTLGPVYGVRSDLEDWTRDERKVEVVAQNFIQLFREI